MILIKKKPRLTGKLRVESSTGIVFRLYFASSSKYLRRISSSGFELDPTKWQKLINNTSQTFCKANYTLFNLVCVLNAACEARLFQI